MHDSWKWEWCWSKRWKVRRQTQSQTLVWDPRDCDCNAPHSPPPTCSADLWTLTCARARSAAIQVRAARSTGGKNLTCVENEKHARPYIFCKRACCFNTYTVGLWRPLWSLAVGDGLCPAANDDAAPIEEDCGGGGGGGGNVSWNKQANNTDKFSRIIMLRS